MKKKLTLCLSCLFACTLCACAAEGPASLSAQSASAASEPQSAVASESAASSVPASSSFSAPEAETAELTIERTTDAGNPVELTLTVPSTWEFDGYSTFTDTESGIKAMELVAIYEIADPANPITDEMRAPFTGSYDGVAMPSGLVQGVSNVNGYPMEYFRTSSVPDGGDFTWYTFFTFSCDEKYVYQMHFFTTDANANVASFFDVIASAHAE